MGLGVSMIVWFLITCKYNVVGWDKKIICEKDANGVFP
jgi:hypothetical protein